MLYVNWLPGDASVNSTSLALLRYILDARRTTQNDRQKNTIGITANREYMGPSCLCLYQNIALSQQTSPAAFCVSFAPRAEFEFNIDHIIL